MIAGIGVAIAKPKTLKPSKPKIRPKMRLLTSPALEPKLGRLQSGGKAQPAQGNLQETRRQGRA